MFLAHVNLHPAKNSKRPTDLNFHSDIIAMTDETRASREVSHYQVWIEFLTLKTFQNDFFLWKSN